MVWEGRAGDCSPYPDSLPEYNRLQGGSLLLISTLLIILFSQFAGQDQPSNAEAQRLLEQIELGLKQQPSNPRLLAARGLALERLNRDRDALQSFEKSLAISPKFLIALDVFKGQIDPYYGVPVDAQGELVRYVRGGLKLKGKGDVHGLLGSIAYTRGDMIHAERDFRMALELHIQSRDQRAQFAPLGGRRGPGGRGGS